jgi:uncharacterized protein
MKRVFWCALVLVCFGAPAWAFKIPLDPPGDRDFILDKAGLIAVEDAATIKASADKLLSETGIPVVVVTIPSMAEYGASDMRIETFATLLFDQWGVGHKEINGQSWNRGILLVVSAGDRKARIELGADWAREYDATCDQIMQGHIIPRFKQGEYSGGIVAGVNALDQMARGIPIPSGMLTFGNGLEPQWYHYAIPLVAIGLVIFTVVSLIRRGSSGWAWLFWAAIFGIIGLILYNALRNSGGSGGGFSGGSFGGGFSGGGGATGSW